MLQDLLVLSIFEMVDGVIQNNDAKVFTNEAECRDEADRIVTNWVSMFPDEVYWVKETMTETTIILEDNGCGTTMLHIKMSVVTMKVETELKVK